MYVVSDVPSNFSGNDPRDFYGILADHDNNNENNNIKNEIIIIMLVKERNLSGILREVSDTVQALFISRVGRRGSLPFVSPHQAQLDWRFIIEPAVRLSRYVMIAVSWLKQIKVRF